MDCGNCAAITCETCQDEDGAVDGCKTCEGTGVSPNYISCKVCDGEDDSCKYCEGNGFVPADYCADCGGTGSVAADTPYYSTWTALLAPVIAIALALITKEVYSSLIIGVLVGGLLTSNFNVVSTVDSVINNGLIRAVSDTAGIFVFLVILGVMVALVNQAGGSAAFGRWAQKNIKSKTGAAFCTFVLGILIFIDDYFNCLTVGGVMRPVTDSKKISRAKFAYLIDATAAPVCMIAPISSWAAAVSGYIKGEDGLALFVKAIPYNLYSILTFVFIIAIMLMKMDYGPMKRHEIEAEKGNLSYGGESEGKDIEYYNRNGRVIDLLLPIIVLIIACVLALIYVGGFFDASSGYKGDFIGSFGNTDATVGLPLGGFVALVFTIIYLIIRRILNFKEAMTCVPRGFVAMVPAILILTLATALKNMTGLLGADVFVGGIMEGSAQGLANFLPAIIFLVAIGLSFSTGTSWGTFGILIPIVVAIFSDGGALLIIGMSACLAGSVCGDHCSPISDTTIMSSAGAQCNHVAHVSTQLPYALTVAGVSFIGYLMFAFVKQWFIVLPAMAILLVAVLFAIKAMDNKKRKA
ncbi:MAG: Na+/H+ antiporter NhaC family protein [Ruminococcaceae bacterium]|nr:Na+/H+ antiporter NhaC family protein [Oscillospiraceae bacterium]